MSHYHSGFDEIKLGNAVTFQRGFDITKSEQTEGEIPIVSSSGVSSFHNQWKANGPGVVIGRKGTLGTVHYLNNNYWPHDTTLWVKDFKGNVRRFIYYFLQTLHLESFDTGSSNPTLNRNHAHKIKIIFPKSVDTQKRIAAILSAYDELIENNQRRITLLEKMIEEIYREWFVRLRFPGYEKVRKVKGVPAGWGIARIDDGIKFDKGISYSGEYLSSPDEGVPMVNLKCITVDSQFRRDGVKHYKGEYRKQHVVQEGDIVLANTDLTQSGGIIGNPALVPKIGAATEMIISHHLCAVRLGVYEKNRFYYFHLLRSQSFKGHAFGYANGATVLGLRTEDIERFQFIKPDDELIEKFSEIATRHYKVVKSLTEANEVLERARDVLLPRLISGKLSVENLDIQFPPSMEETARAV